MRVTHAGLHLCRTGTFKMQDVFDMVYSLLVFVNIRVILYKTYVVLICGKYNTLTLEFKINIAIRVNEYCSCVPPLSIRNSFRLGYSYITTFGASPFSATAKYLWLG